MLLDLFDRNFPVTFSISCIFSGKFLVFPESVGEIVETEIVVVEVVKRDAILLE